jgi:hypothetical protein
MLNSILSAALFLTASTATAQPAQTPPPANAPAQGQQITPPPAFIQAAQAFGQCVEGASGRIATTVTPEAAATQALAACAAQKTAIETQFEAWVASDAFPAEGRDIARTQFRAQFGQVETQIAGAIRQQRAAAAAPAAPATPSN